LLQRRALAATAVVQNVGAVVEDAADAVAAEVADHRHALGLDDLLNGVADVAEGGAGLDDGQARGKRVIGDLDQLAGAGVDLADRVHAAGVAVPTVDDDRVVDVDDVAFLENLVARNAVADDVVDRGADGLFVALVAEAGGQAAVVEGELADAVVNLAGGDAGLDVLRDHVEGAGDEVPRLAHALPGLLVLMDANFAGANEGVAVQFGGLVHGRLSAAGGRQGWWGSGVGDCSTDAQPGATPRRVTVVRKSQAPARPVKASIRARPAGLGRPSASSRRALSSGRFLPSSRTSQLSGSRRPQVVKA